MRIFLSVGHSILKNGVCTSASGYVNEYRYNKELAKYVKKYIEASGHTCDIIVCPEYRFTNKSQERTYKLPIANSGKYDLVCELHLNASNGAGHGSEVYYYGDDSKGRAIASRICNNLESLGFYDRGVKTAQLYMINETKPTAVLIESFFCDNKGDSDLANRVGYDKMGKAIAEGLIGNKINTHAKPNTQAKKPQCVMYYADGNKAVAEVIANIKGIPCFRDNGRDLPNDKHKDWDMIYIGSLGKDRGETAKIALNKYLGANIK